MFRATFSPIIRSTWLYLQYLVVFTRVAADWCLGWVETELCGLWGVYTASINECSWVIFDPKICLFPTYRMLAVSIGLWSYDHIISIGLWTYDFYRLMVIWSYDNKSIEIIWSLLAYDHMISIGLWSYDRNMSGQPYNQWRVHASTPVGSNSGEHYQIL